MSGPGGEGGRDASTGRIRWGRALAGGAFLAASWTWCIGMFLPVYLVFDFGWPGWVAFAVPNVIGAAAVGLIVQTRSRSEAIGRGHGPAMIAFSIVTILFHISFLAWFFQHAMQGLGAPPVSPEAPDWLRRMIEIGAPVAPVAIVVVAAAVVSVLPWGAWLTGGVLTIAFSVATAVCARIFSGESAMAWPAASGAAQPAALVWLVPALCFGFLLCPHLDFTLHRVRRMQEGRTGSMAFLIGFLGLFPLMIVYTLFYAEPLMQRWVSLYVVAHIVAQSVFTMGAHMRELSLRARASASPRRWTLAALAAQPVWIALAAGSAMTAFTGRERVVYEMFLGAYALLFPAYVWCAVIPRRGVGRRAAMGAWAVAVALAAPLFWLGIVEKMWWPAAAGVGLALAAPLVAQAAFRARAA